MTIMTQYHVGSAVKRKTTSLYLSMAEKKRIVKDLGTAALYIIEFYLSVITRKHYVIHDVKTAIATGLKLRTVQEIRRKLIQNNYFYVIKTTSSNATMYLYCVLKEGVCINKYFIPLFNCKGLREVYDNFNRKDIDELLEISGLHQNEIADIKELLDDFHQKAKRSNKHRHDWQPLMNSLY